MHYKIKPVDSSRRQTNNDQRRMVKNFQTRKRQLVRYDKEQEIMTALDYKPGEGFVQPMVSSSNVFSDDMCEKVLRIGDSKKDEWETIDIEKFKDGVSAKFDELIIDEQWIYEQIWPWGAEANNEWWKIPIDGCQDSKLIRMESDHFCDFHSKDDPNIKFVMEILLNNPNEFEGGEFEFTERHAIVELPPYEKGSMRIFPAFNEYRITPVSRGVKYSLMNYFTGPPAKEVLPETGGTGGEWAEYGDVGYNDWEPDEKD